MSAAKRRTGRRWVAPLLGGLALLAALLWMDRGSMERGNRLFNDGRLDAAERLYLAAAEKGDPSPAATYNLGTARLGRGDLRAERHLAEAARSSDPLARQRGSYNLGYALLTRVDASVEPDSAIQLLAASVSGSRVALRLDPRDQDARWNLALAQRMLDSLLVVYRVSDRRSESGDDETRLEEQSFTRSGEGDGVSGQEPENPQSADNIGQRAGAAMGTREAWAMQDPGPLGQDAAMLLLRDISDVPEQLVRGMLWAHRPDVAWWNAEQYPGGDW